jgi:hypothetical protein
MLALPKEESVVKGRVVIFNPEASQFNLYLNDESSFYDFSTHAVSKKFAQQRNLIFKEFPGKTVGEIVDQTGAAFAINGHQGNFYLPNTLHIQDGRLIIKNAPGVGQNSHQALNGDYLFFVLDRGHYGLVDLTINDDKPVGDISGVKTAITGPVLLRQGKDVSREIKQAVPAVGQQEITWDKTKDSHAFSLLGKDTQGRLVFLTMAGDPAKGEAMLEDMVAAARKFDLVDAILLGTSGDAQQFVQGHTTIVAKSRVGSVVETSGTTPVRKLGSIIYTDKADFQVQEIRTVSESIVSKEVAQKVKEAALDHALHIRPAFLGTSAKNT